MTGAVFVVRRVAWYMALIASLILVAPLLSGGGELSAGERLLEGITPVIVFVFATWMPLWLRREFESGERRYRNLARSKDEFVTSISHELRTPLTAVVGLAHELRDRHTDFDREEIAEFIATIADRGAEMAAIVEDLLVVGRNDSSGIVLDMQPIDLRSEVTSVAAAADIPLECAIDDEVPMTLADPMRVRQILRNLFANAQRYGGKRIRVLMARNEHTTTVEVRDSRRAIPVAERNSIFEAYYRTRQPHGVTASVGLGLTVSRQLARAMGGDVTDAHDGVESTFMLTLSNAPLPNRVATPTLQTTP